jgi:hypothetical protein
MFRQIYKKLYLKTIFRETADKLKPATEPEKLLVDELLDDFKKISIIDTKNLSGAALAWANNMNALRDLVFRDDPRRFLQWDVIRKTMFVCNQPYVLTELKSLKGSNKFEEYWRQGIVESSVGAPYRNIRFKHSSSNLIHNAYHLQQFEERTNIALNKIDFVLEFGGGYGSMCRLFKNLGFNKRYVLYDLPAFTMLQKYYLKSLGYKISTVEEFCREDSGIICISGFEELKAALKTAISSNKNLFLGTWSISETPKATRDSIFQLVEDFNLFLLAYQDKFGEVDNNIYFKNFQSSHPQIQWFGGKIAHIPTSNYLFGKT